jgi:hypothetical protein
MRYQSIFRLEAYCHYGSDSRGDMYIPQRCCSIRVQRMLSPSSQLGGDIDITVVEGVGMLVLVLFSRVLDGMLAGSHSGSSEGSIYDRPKVLYS